MATISKPELRDALLRLGELAAAEGGRVELLLLGGSAMVLAFDARDSTRDVDVLILAPEERDWVRRLAVTVAGERNWPADWLNEGAKGFVMRPDPDRVLIDVLGLVVRVPTVEQLLAMKLCAWRDDVDIADAGRLLRELPADRDGAWRRVERHLQPGRELKARYAFDDLWENLHGQP